MSRKIKHWAANFKILKKAKLWAFVVYIELFIAIVYLFNDLWFRQKILRPETRKLAILKESSCLNYRARRHPLDINLFYISLRFYIITFMKFEENMTLTEIWEKCHCLYFENYKLNWKKIFTLLPWSEIECNLGNKVRKKWGLKRWSSFSG